mmetsp:Transcript_37551/g.79809  ORF Transcript_37551/g.79809 Transcript_37551/m.79809 type:complete len:256 (+) Transcript_37551:758-1525(+)
MHIAEGRSHGEVAVGHLFQGLIDLPDLLWLGVEVLRVGVLVVHPVFLAASDPQLHLERTTNLCHACQVLDAHLDVLLQRLLREVDHVRGEEGLTVQLEVALVGVEHAVQPGEEGFRAMIRVKDHRHTVLFSHRPHVVRTRDGACDAGMKVGVVEALASVELRSTRGELNHDRRVELPSCLQASVDPRGGHTIHSRDRELLLFCPVKEILKSLPSDHSRVHAIRELREGAERGPLAEHGEPLLFDAHRRGSCSCHG